MEEECFIKVTIDVTKSIGGQEVCNESATQLVPCSATSSNPQILCGVTVTAKTNGPTFQQVTACADLDGKESNVVCP